MMSKNSTPGGIRTPDTWFRRPVLYPLSYGRMIYFDSYPHCTAVGAAESCEMSALAL
jgi:hypothetical protein